MSYKFTLLDAKKDARNVYTSQAPAGQFIVLYR